MIISWSILFLFKICYFLIYPISLIVRNLEMNPTRIIDPQHTQQALGICAFNYIILQLLQNVFETQVCLWALILLIIGMYFARKKGKVTIIFQKIAQRANKPVGIIKEN